MDTSPSEEMSSNADWIFHPLRHGVFSATPPVPTEIVCYLVPRCLNDQNPLLLTASLKLTAEMNPRNFLTKVLRKLSLDERESVMVDEKFRRNSFLVNWPHDGNLSGVKMAQAGFYCLDDGDRVQCVFCRGSLHNWELGDNPSLEHAKLFPFCRFVKGLECGNKEYKNELTVEESEHITLSTMPEMSQNIDGNASTDSGAFGLSTNKAANIKFAPYEARKNTYGRWPATNVLRPEPLCEAGFYYTGVDDQVRCFFCSGGLREWSSQDDPWEEHARWFPDCTFLLQQKGESYVNEVHERTPAAKKCVRKALLQKKAESEQPQKVSNHQAMYDLCVKLNHQKHVVDMAINRNGKPFDSAKDLIEAVYQIEEEEGGHLNIMKDGVPTTSMVPSFTFMSAENQPITEQQSSAMAVECVDGNLLGVVDTTDSEVLDSSCRSCYRKISQVVPAEQIGLPCGHLIYCASCIQEQKVMKDKNKRSGVTCSFAGGSAVFPGAMRTALK